MPVTEDTVPKVVECVGEYDLRIVLADESPESRQRWEQRSEALAAWLLSRWREEHGQEGRN